MPRKRLTEAAHADLGVLGAGGSGLGEAERRRHLQTLPSTFHLSVLRTCPSFTNTILPAFTAAADLLRRIFEVVSVVGAVSIRGVALIAANSHLLGEDLLANALYDASDEVADPFPVGEEVQDDTIPLAVADEAWYVVFGPHVGVGLDDVAQPRQVGEESL